MAGFRSLLLLVTLGILAACEDTNCIKGNGEVVQRTLDLQSFNEVEANGDFKVYITQGPTQHVEVKGEPNILNELKTDVANNKWSIGYNSCIRRSKAVEVYITMPEVRSLYLNGSGLINSQNVIMATELPVTVNGSGKIDLDLTAAKVITRITGSGEINLQGEAPLHHVSISGSGKAKAYDLVADNVTVNISGSGLTEVTATDALDVSITGSGEVYYKGNPATVNKSVSGSGKVVKR